MPFVGVGCAGAPTEIADGPQYPAVAQSRVLDVQVFRDETQLTLTNTSARTFGPCRVWVNQWYSLPIEGLAAAQTITLDLGAFKDRYGTPFRAGGFFATERPDRVVLVQIEDGAEVVGLAVVAGEIE
ncbi:MAG: hypothetical protein ACKVS8_09575 [Phycisphaerales bacterium]